MKIKQYIIILSVFSFLMHLGIYFFFGYIITTMGFFVKFLLFLLIFYIADKFMSVYKKTKNAANIKLSIISIGVTVCLLEFILLLTGFADTYLEKRFFRYTYHSCYSKEDKDRFMVNSKDFYIEAEEFSFFRTVNSLGLSDIEHSVEKGADEYRVIGLGDSFTEGDGAHADSTWLKFLERSLSVYPIKYKLTFMNAGISGSDPFFEYVLLKDKLLNYSPDMVILAINNSDIQDVVIRGGWERFTKNGEVRYSTPPWWEPIFASSKLSRLVFYALGYNQMLYKRRGTLPNIANQKIIDVLYAFKELATKYNFHLTVIFHPHSNEINNNKMALDAVKDALKTDTSFDIFDMLEYFNKIEKINLSNNNEYFWSKDWHHNAKGYEAFARGVEWHLNNNGIIDFLKHNEPQIPRQQDL